MADPEIGRHSAALKRMLDSSGLGKLDEEAALVELLKDYAEAMDNGGGARVSQAYLSALKDARRVLAAAPGAPGSSEPEAPEVPDDALAEEDSAARAHDEAVADLESFKRAKGRASVG